MILNLESFWSLTYVYAEYAKYVFDKWGLNLLENQFSIKKN